PEQARHRRLPGQRRRDAGQGRQPGPDRRAGHRHRPVDAGQPQVSWAPSPCRDAAFGRRRRFRPPKASGTAMRLRPAVLLLLLPLTACEAPAPAPTATAPQVPGTVAIAEVQGRGPRSPLEGREVTVEGVVTGNFAKGLGGVFIQSLAEDGDPATAEGLYLTRAPDAEPRLRAGDHILARGQVVELGEDGASLTALDGASVEVLGRAEVSPLELREPPADATGWEALEGRLIPLPGEPALALARENARRRLRLDDARDRRDPDRIWYLPQPLSAEAPVRAGSRVRGATGVLDQRHGEYRLQLISELEAVEQAPRPERPEVAGEIRLASLNLLNLFNGDGEGGGFPTPRGAATEAEYH